MNKGGRPTSYRKKFHPDDFIQKSKQGKNVTQIALLWDVDKDSIYEWAKKHKEFSVAFKKGKQFCEAWYTNLGQAAMFGPVKIDGKSVNVNLGFFVWMTKNVCKWSDKIDQKSSVKIDEVKPQLNITLPQNGFESPTEKKGG